MTLRLCAFLTAFAVLLVPALARADVTMDLNNKDNVVANLLEGAWVVDTEALGVQRSGGKMIFTRDPAGIPQRVFDDFGRHSEEPLTVYAVGMLTFVSDDGRETKVPYFLTTINGNPNVVWFRERGGDPFGDSERLIVMAFRTNNDAPAGPNDRLFIGGDFNNQAMTPFVRQAE